MVGKRQTEENLMRAFAGECQAVQRYRLAACAAQEEKLEVIARVFAWTGKQEEAHAKLFYAQLSGRDGDNLDICGGYPVNLSKDAASQLRWAIHNEREEADVIYPDFARVAAGEGQSEAAALFRAVAAIEQTHGARFAQLLALVEQEKLHGGQGEGLWMCLHCGHVHRGGSAPAVCPVCSHPQGFFVPCDLRPFRLPES